MRTTYTLAGLIAAAGLAGSAQAELLAYEGFDYAVGSDINSTLSGGTGFADAWVAGQQGGVITVYDAASAVGIENNNAGSNTTIGNVSGDIEWDGVIDNLPTATTPNRYISTSPVTVNSTDRITANRTLSSSAGVLAGDDDTLWASVVWHQEGDNFGRHIGFALGTDGLSNRSVNIDTSGNFGAGLGNALGVGGAFNEKRVTPAAWSNGAQVDRFGDDKALGVDAVEYPLTSQISFSEDNLVVLKFVFADGVGLDRVYAWSFTETELATVTEADFDTNAVFAEAAIDQDTLNILSFSQSRGAEAVDEIRLGDNFEDILGIISDPGIPGDTDSDGDIDDSDLGTSLANYTGPLDPGVGSKTAAEGDTDGDGDVDDSDLGTSLANYTGPIAVSVPEPTSLALLGLGGLLAARRRRA